MEGVSANVYRGLKGYWMRRGYKRLHNGDGGVCGSRRRKNRVELAAARGSTSNQRRRFWRIKIKPKLKLKLRFSPKKFFIGLRDAYVKMMLRVVNTRMISTSGGGNPFGGGDGVSGFGLRPPKEYDERMIVEIYKSLMVAQGQLMPRDASRIAASNLL